MEGLPKGLVTTTGKLSSSLDDLDLVNVDDIVKLWKVYHTNPRVLESNVGFRLENLFWRVWGNKTVLTTLRGSRLAKVFSLVSDPNSMSLNTMKQLKMAHDQSVFTKRSEEKVLGQSINSNGTGRSPLPPILKKPNTAPANGGQGESQKKTRLLITDIGGQNMTRKSSNPPTPVSPGAGEVTNRQSQKKTYFVAGRGAKRRPVLVRRKSSQQSTVTNATRMQSPQMKSTPQPVEKEIKNSEIKDDGDDDDANWQSTDLPLDLPLPEPAMKEEKEPLPSSFVSGIQLVLTTQKKPPFEHENSAPILPPHSKYQPSRKPLVEKGFRIRFVDQVRQERLEIEASLGVEPDMGVPNSTSPETNMTVSSSSPFGQSNGDGLTPASSAMPDLSASGLGTGGQSKNEEMLSPFNDNASLSSFHLSEPRAPSQLSLLVDQNREAISCGNSFTTEN